MNILFMFAGLFIGYVGCAMILLCRKITIRALRVAAICAVAIVVGLFCSMFPNYFWTMFISSMLCMAGSLFAISIVTVT